MCVRTVVIVFVCALAVAVAVDHGDDNDLYDEAHAQMWMTQLDKKLSDVMFATSSASWNYRVNITEHNANMSVSECSDQQRNNKHVVRR